jgi:catechol 2,3-dioxygenase-like lactoylglutathione lyase family enzyme
MDTLLTGIQQVGIGVSDVDKAFAWYRKHLGFDVPVFDDAAEAALMIRYTGGEVHSRRALLALNLNGGGGFEIWQFKSRTSEPASFKPRFGDLGINAVRLKSRNVEALHNELLKQIPDHLSRIYKNPDDRPTFIITDPFGNRFRIVEGDSWFSSDRTGQECSVATLTGGVCGVTIGVSDIDKAIPLYREVLGFEQVIYDESGRFKDLESKENFRRVLLHKPEAAEGAFSRLFGHVEVELLQSLDHEGRKIFENRYWGDLGFIHACFDVNDMEGLQVACEAHGYPFTVDSADSFDMGEAAGRFSYIEDPDGTLIEFVQTHKVPILKKIGWYIDLQKRRKKTALPDWMLKSMSLNRVKG